MGNCPIKFRSNMATLENTTDLAMSENNGPIIVSLYDIPSQSPLESSIHMGERLTVLSDDGEFCMVRSTITGNESYIPSNYTAKVINRWQYEGISRSKAEELLLLPFNHTGAFLVRKSQTNPDSYSLSVRGRSDSLNLGTVKHYRICRLQNDWFYISPSITFNSLCQLVDHYSESADGLCCSLREPCIIHGSISTSMTRPYPKAIRRPTLNWKDVDRSMIFRKTRADSEDSLVSEGLREAIRSYIYMTEAGCQDCGTRWNT
ncbi:src-like-adapter 2 [Esox lucius]|uniref:Uncharacterized protein n=1 Tax=Esox lucius TaxID=8010 RepID=A0A3P8XGN9_ESOLU|nr:src-like-adapter 2 [Esox lucius]